MKKQILLIDDDEDELKIFMEALNELDEPFKCSYAPSAEQAFKILNFVMPDFIFVDFNMPKTNGLKCIEELKKMESLQNVPVFLYSNFVSDANNQRAKIIGAASCIQKPNSIKILSDILKDIFKKTVNHSHRKVVEK